MKSYVRPSLKKPVILFVFILLLTIGLSILWNVVLVHDYNRIRDLASASSTEAGTYHWVYLTLGTAMFIAIISLVIWLMVTLFAAVKFNQQMAIFLASVSHELNSPLSAIKLYAQTLRNPDIAPSERLKFVDTILSNVDRLGRHIQNILRSAQDEQNRLRPVLETLPYGDFLREYVAECRGIVERRVAGGAIEFLGGGDTPVRIDRGLFRQVLDNLVDNAVKYAGPEPVRITLRASAEPDGFVILDLTDNGRGIPADVIPWLFQRFHRGDEDDPAHHRDGIGLGLSIVRAIVLAHGGTVDARSAGPGRGATMRIVLPAAHAAEAVA